MDVTSCQRSWSRRRRRGCCRAGLKLGGELVPRPRPYEPTSSETENRCPVRGLTSRPRARRRIDTPSEVLRARPQARRRIGSPSEALRARPRVRRRIGTSSEALWRGASGEAENRYLVRGLVARGLGRVGESVPRPRPRMVLGRACFGRAWMLFEVGRAIQPGLGRNGGLPAVVFWLRCLQVLSNFLVFA